MDNLVNVLGVLGAYFAVLLVLAVAVETILEPFTYIKRQSPGNEKFCWKVSNT